MSKSQRSFRKENLGWLQVVSFVIIYPVLFFFCVFFPIWMGWTQPFP